MVWRMATGAGSTALRIEPSGAVTLNSSSEPALFGISAPRTHLNHFFTCVRNRETPISDLKSHNLMLNICHAINIALRLNKNLNYDPAARNFGNDSLANSLIGREQRKGFETEI